MLILLVNKELIYVLMHHNGRGYKSDVTALHNIVTSRVTKTRVGIGESVYWIFTRRNYN
jgi:hypothetical protein